MKGKKYILLKAKIPVWLKYWAYKKGALPTLKNLLLGYTKQQRTTGANKMKFTERTNIGGSSGVDYICNSIGQVTMVGTALSQVGFSYNQSSDTVTLNAGTYKFKVIGKYEGVRFSRTDTNSFISLNSEGEGTVVIENDNTSFRILSYVFVGTTYDCDFYITLAEGEIATNERYTGGISAPRYDFEIPIENVTGHNCASMYGLLLNYSVSVMYVVNNYCV